MYRPQRAQGQWWETITLLHNGVCTSFFFFFLVVIIMHCVPWTEMGCACAPRFSAKAAGYARAAL